MAGSSQKPNEDAFSSTTYGSVFMAGIFDGVTSLKPIKALGTQSGARFASHFLKETLVEYVAVTNCEEIVRELNNRLGKKCLGFEGVALEDTHTLPASTATIARVDLASGLLSFGHIGDSIGTVFYKDGSSAIFTDDRNKAFDEKIYGLIKVIAKEKDISFREARDDERIHQALMAMFTRRNNAPDGKGSGLINGDPHAGLYIQSGKIVLQGVKALLLATDGLVPRGWSLEDGSDRQKLLDILTAGGFRALFDAKRKSEDDDPDWHYIRFKHSDDATGILVQF